ncbi:YeiH family protein [Caulobacter sp. X]|uniref:YeiH family protein n=1 Tax=Caulobacter sp. X TaxID=2048901 RepID=UPI000C15F4FE|nr:putative sulfate exporter family transporter [Caulobacter sp. X]PIC00073.1 putative sulfate exporter family transporter [Caulobacter sp. X]
MARIGTYAPGLALAALATLAAAYVSDHYGAPLTLMCLLFGLSMNFLSVDSRLEPGLTIASRTLLRWGIVLVAARVTFGQIAQLGPQALIAIVVIVALTLSCGVLAARKLGFSPAFGALCGGAVAICGASAAMAFASLLGEKRIAQAQLTLVLVGISACSAVAMALYPALAHHLHFSDLRAGFMLGASIHDVAQALGAGYSFSPEAGETATIVKLTRVALLAPAMAVVALFIPKDPNAEISTPILPWFVIGFFGLAAVNSVGLIPAVVANGASKGATALLACAVTATGIRSNMQTLTKTGPRPLLAIVIASVLALALSVAAAAFVIRA